MNASIAAWVEVETGTGWVKGSIKMINGADGGIRASFVKYTAVARRNWFEMIQLLAGAAGSVGRYAVFTRGCPFVD